MHSAIVPMILFQVQLKSTRLACVFDEKLINILFVNFPSFLLHIIATASIWRRFFS